ncbi:hypothetical protein BJY52DRAFT_1098472, partial [Lactarius psammicola]
GGLSSAEELTIRAFWKLRRSLVFDAHPALLYFVTSGGRPPHLGSSGLVHKFHIRDAGDDENRLPNRPDLLTSPQTTRLLRHKSERVLRQKLLQTALSGAGF